MDVIFDKLAYQEFKDAAELYEFKVPGLGERFRNELKRAVKRIIEYPDSWAIEKGDVRKYILHTFPYKILYSIEPDYIYIIAVAHGHRRPYYWIERVRED